MARHQDDRVPQVVEDYLIGVYGDAGAVGAGIASAVTLSDRSRMSRAGRRGGERGARWQQTKIAERTGPVSEPPAVCAARLQSALPQTKLLTSDHETSRFVIPQGRLGLQRVVVELVGVRSREDIWDVRLRVFAKEGLAYRGMVERLAGQAWSVITST